MSNFYLRTESIKPEEILNLCVKSKQDEQIIRALRSSEPCILEGSRGTGKSFLMRVAQQEIDDGEGHGVAVFVSFNISSLISTNDRHQFYHWMLAKTLRALLVKLKKKGYVVSPFSAGLLSNDECNNQDSVEMDLERIVKSFEGSYRSLDQVLTTSLPDIEDVKEAIQEICEENKIDRIYFFFDEAAHVFRPEQQRQFFSLFKDLRSPYVTCNAAIYPGVTYFGDSFEPIHDCIYKVIERDIRDPEYLGYFKEIALKQADATLANAIERNVDLFATIAFAGGGNPRMILKTLQDLAKFNSTNVDQVIKDFYRGSLDNTTVEYYNIYDWGLQSLDKLGYPVNKYWQRSKSHRDDGSIGRTVFVKDRLVGSTSCRILIDTTGFNNQDFFQQTGTISIIAGVNPGTPVAQFGQYPF